MRESRRRRVREAVPSALLAAVIFLPLLLTRPGRVGADTKTYLYVDPGRMLSRAPEMWDSHIGLGTVTHQNIGYLWPIGPYYWFCDAIGIPDWVAQRVWLGLIMFLAGVGVRYMLKALGQEGPHVTAATFVYALTPYVLTLGARLSVILLPYAGLPWLIGLAARSLERKRWREPACFALVVASIGSVNATALILVCVGPILWMACEVFVQRDEPLREALKAGLRISVLTIGCSLWWLAGLWAQGGYGIQILRYTETARTVATASVSLEVLRGLGYWFFYGDDRYGPWIAPSRWYTNKVMVIATSFAVSGVALIGMVVARFRDRVFFTLLLVAGLVLAVGGHPWSGGAPVPSAFRAVLESDAGLSMRSLPRAAPLVILALSVFTGSLVASIAAHKPALARPITAAVMVLAVLNLSPLWTGRMVDENLDRPEKLPTYWLDAASFLDERPHETRVLEVPGSDFASYRWGNTVDPILPGLIDRPYVARELIPYGSPPSADLLNAFDARLQELTYEPESLAPIARLLGVGDIVVRSDLSYERYNTPRPRLLWDSLSRSPGVRIEGEFGPKRPNVARKDLPLLDEIELLTPVELANAPEVGVLAVQDPAPIVRAADSRAPVIVAGSGDGIIDLASAGLIDGRETILYAATYHDRPDDLRKEVGPGTTLVLTDSNRRAGTRWGTVRDTRGYTERPDETPLRVDPTSQPLDVFDTDDSTTQSVTVSNGGVTARATTYGNVVSLTPESRADNAVDGDFGTAWTTGGFDDAEGESLELTFREPVTTDQVRLLQTMGGVRNRTITEVSIRLDDGEPIRAALTDVSRPEKVGDDPAPGQTITFPEQTFSTMTITIERTNPRELRRYDGISAVGFAEVAVAGADGKPIEVDAWVRLPTQLLDDLGPASTRSPLVVSLTRQRTAGVVAVRSSPEPQMERLVELPQTRAFALSGQVRLSPATVSDSIIDKALGLPGLDDGGIEATSSRHLPGGARNRAMSAIDGDPDTWWSPGFLDQYGEFVKYRSPEPVEFSTMNITVLNDGRHSVPRRLELSVGNAGSEPIVQTIDLGEIPDQNTLDGSVTIPIRLDRAVSGTEVSVRVPAAEPATSERPDSVRYVRTRDYFSDLDVPMPIGIVDLGIPGLRSRPVPSRVDETCRPDLVTVDGKSIDVSLSGSTDDLLSGRPVDITSCDDDVDLAKGTSKISTKSGRWTGLDIDRLVLRSAAGGEADSTDGLLIPAADRRTPKIEVRRAGSIAYDIDVPAAEDPFWLVVGQSHNLGWKATLDGKDLGEPTLIDGYANGWVVPAGSRGTIHVEWAPQKVVWAAIWASVLAILLSILLVVRPRSAVADHDLAVPLDERPSMPRPYRTRRILRYAGPLPGRFAIVTTTIAAGLFGFLVIGPVPGLALAVAALGALRFRRFRPVLTVGGPLLFAFCVGYVCARQLLRPYPGGFDWPSYFAALNQPAWTAVALIALDVVVDRCWLRRWAPTENSPD